MDLKKNIFSPTNTFFDDPSLPLAIVVTRTSWDEPPRMRHQVTRQLMRFYNVVYIDLSNFGYPKKDIMKKAGDKLLIFSPGIKKYISKRLYANEPITHHLVNYYYKKKIINFLSELSFRKKILINFVYDFWEIMKGKDFNCKYYICYDEFPKMQRRSYKRNRTKSWYQEKLFQNYENIVALHAHRCFTPHYVLRKKLKKVNKKVEMLFHAHEFALEASKPISRKRGGLIKVGFVGYINWRLNFDYLKEVLGQADMHLYLIGPIEGREIEILKNHSRLTYLPPVFGNELHKLISEMSVMVMPYDSNIPEVSILTTNSKTFQYIASGRPVVTSDLPHYIKMPENVIYRAKGSHEFVEKIRQAYKEDGPELVTLRLKIAAQNTWKKRGDLLHSIVEQDLLRLN